jgi:ATP-dependent 26S proteasome regulatory subunit
MKTQITNYIRAGYPGLFINTYEESRVEAVVRDAIQEINKVSDAPYTMYLWSCTEGLVNCKNGKTIQFEGEDTTNPMLALSAVIAAEAPAVFIFRDFHMFMEMKDPRLTRKVKDVLAVGKATGKHLLVLGCRTTLTPELEKEMALIQFALPDKETLRRELHEILASVNSSVTPDVENEVLQASKGLTTAEAANAYAISFVESKRICPKIIYREKCATIKKNGLLEVVESNTTLDDIGGLEVLKANLLSQKDAFTESAQQYGLPEPRGFLAVGQPGTGKTLTAKACGSIFGVPILRLDAARLYGGLVGQTEGNWRAVHATALAMAPCILHIDEVDGMTSGAASSGQTDGGTTSRTLKSILQDVQDNSAGIFYVMTANDIDNIPSPLLRRLDTVWNVELPHSIERAAIWRIQIKKWKRDPEKYDIQALAEATEGFSGAEIEKVVKRALFAAFSRREEPTQADLITCTKNTVPVSVTMAEDIERRRKRLEGVAECASQPPTPTPATPDPTRKINASKPFKG